MHRGGWSSSHERPLWRGRGRRLQWARWAGGLRWIGWQHRSPQGQGWKEIIYIANCLPQHVYKPTRIKTFLHLGIDERRWAPAQRRQSLEAPDQAGKVLLMPESHEVT